jgi:methyl-accepting chemotaxis protein
MNNKKNSYLGKKILYAFVIIMCSLIIFTSAIGIIGVWTVGQSVGHAAVAVMKVVENSANDIQASIQKVDGVLERLQARTTEITDATQKLSENVSDKGLILVLLPEEREQQLTENMSSVRDTFGGIKESITSVLDLYRSIDAMPFINLPSLSEDQVNNIEESVGQTGTRVETLRSAIADFRSGATDKIDKVEAAANTLGESIQKARDRVAQVDSRMAKLEAFSIRMQHDIPVILNIISVIFSLLFAFVIWTQVEVIKQYMGNWRLLGQDEKPAEAPQPALPAETPAKPALPAEKPAKTAKSTKNAKPTKSAKSAKSSKKKAQPAKKK